MYQKWFANDPQITISRWCPGRGWKEVKPLPPTVKERADLIRTLRQQGKEVWMRVSTLGHHARLFYSDSETP